jgi:hypothetical protein
MRRNAASRVRADFERMTRTPRFEEEAGYVPYFWLARRSGRAHARWGDVLAFTVSQADREMWPELAGVDVVCVRVTDGRVHETTAEDAAKGE